MKVICSVAQEASNDPCEDRFCCRVTEGLALFGVFDGHGGVRACDIACSCLLDILQLELLPLLKAVGAAVSVDEVGKAFQRAFEECDRRIMESERRRLDAAYGGKHVCKPPCAVCGGSRPASNAGSCALVVAILRGGQLFVANLGDCRAVIAASTAAATAGHVAAQSRLEDAADAASVVSSTAVDGGGAVENRSDSMAALESRSSSVSDASGSSSSSGYSTTQPVPSAASAGRSFSDASRNVSTSDRDAGASFADKNMTIGGGCNAAADHSLLLHSPKTSQPSDGPQSPQQQHPLLAEDAEHASSEDVLLPPFCVLDYEGKLPVKNGRSDSPPLEWSGDGFCGAPMAPAPFAAAQELPQSPPQPPTTTRWTRTQPFWARAASVSTPVVEGNGPIQGEEVRAIKRPRTATRVTSAAASPYVVPRIGTNCVESSFSNTLAEPHGPRPPLLRICNITEDQSCAVSGEVRRLLAMTTDPSPVRFGRSDGPNPGPNALPRVAGSLAVTRALGDFYLKSADLSLEPFAQHVPYISCNPAVYHRQLQNTDYCIVLASDGLWNFVSNEELLGPIAASLACDMKQKGDSHSGDSSSVAEVLSPLTHLCSHASCSSHAVVETEEDHVRASSRASAAYSSAKECDRSALEVFLHSAPVAEAKTTRSGRRVGASSSATERASPSPSRKSGRRQDPARDSGATLATKVVNAWQSSTATQYGMHSGASLASVPAGPHRRRLVDDLTVMVLQFKHNT